MHTQEALTVIYFINEKHLHLISPDHGLLAVWLSQNENAYSLLPPH